MLCHSVRKVKVLSVFLRKIVSGYFHFTVFFMTGLNFLLTFLGGGQFCIISGAEDYNSVRGCRGFFTVVKEKRVIKSQNILIKGLGITKR